MAVLAVVTSSPGSVEGGHLVIARSLVTAAREAGHDAHLVLTPDCQFGRQVFQEIDQVAIMRGCVKWADRVYNLKRIPEQVNNAFQHAMSGKPGPTYLDFPGDILYAKIPEEQVDWSMSGRPILNARTSISAEAPSNPCSRNTSIAASSACSSTNALGLATPVTIRYFGTNSQ